MSYKSDLFTIFKNRIVHHTGNGQSKCSHCGVVTWNTSMYDLRDVKNCLCYTCLTDIYLPRFKEVH